LVPQLRRGGVQRQACNGHQHQHTTLVERNAVEVVAQRLELLSCARVLLGILAGVHRGLEGIAVVINALVPASLSRASPA
jgi:hypothetical protein